MGESNKVITVIFLEKEGLIKGKKDALKKEVYNAREIDRPPEDGARITLTIDQEIQNITEDVII